MFTKICVPFRNNLIGFELWVGFSNSLQSSGRVFFSKFFREIIGELLCLTTSLEFYLFSFSSPCGVSFSFFCVSILLIVSIIEERKFYSCSSYINTYALDFRKFGVIDLMSKLCPKLSC